VQRLAEVCGEVVVVLSPDGEEPSFPPGTRVRTARDAHEGQGPLAGLVAGLEVVVRDRALVAGGDMPDLSPAVLREMLAVADDAAVDAVALSDGGRARPLPCVVTVATARSNAEVLLRTGERSLRALLDSVRVAVIDEATWHRLDPTRRTLRDVDVPADLLDPEDAR
jgi:molybdopterin-guanine dinucleotide biosynthesis protein A